MERMPPLLNKCTILPALLIIALLIPINLTQQTTNEPLQTFTIPNSNYVLLVSQSAFNWYKARETCIKSGYVMSQINTTAQNNEIGTIMSVTGENLQSCWLGAFGIFRQGSNTTIDWNWDYLRHLSWNKSFANQYMVPPRVTIDTRSIQGLLLRTNGRNNEPVWSYGDADIEFQNNGQNIRRCVACLIAATVPTDQPTLSPTPAPSPTISPTLLPSINPSISPSNQPSILPSITPSLTPTISPSNKPSKFPTNKPSEFPSILPTLIPTILPTILPTLLPSIPPTLNPTNIPTFIPSISPTEYPTVKPTNIPTFIPTITPTYYPSINPTFVPTMTPTFIP
eukprot:803098_1